MTDDLRERAWVIVQEEPYHLSQKFEVSTDTAQRERFIQVHKPLLNRRFLVSFGIHRTISWRARLTHPKAFSNLYRQLLDGLL